MPLNRKYPKYRDYMTNVVDKCSHKYLILDRKDFRYYRMNVINGIETDLPKGKLIKIVPARCKSYSCEICGRKKVYDLMDRLKTVDLRGYRFFTLTLRNEYSKENTEKNLKRISDCFNKLNNNLRKLPEFKGLEYFRVVEVGKDGMVHIHGMWNKYIETKKLGIMWYKITGDSFRVRPERVKSKRDALNYLYKYLTKNCLAEYGNPAYSKSETDLFGLDLINSAQLFYENGKRRYSASRGFFKKVMKKDSEYLPYGFESDNPANIEIEIKNLIRSYDLKKEHFDFPFYDEIDSFLQNLF